MKKIILIFAIFSCIATVSKAQDKAFHKGVINVDLGIGFSVYGTQSHEEYDAQVWNGTSIVTERVKKDKRDGAAATIIPVNFEYGIADWFGVGARFGYSKYIANGDSTNNNTIPSRTRSPRAVGSDSAAAELAM